MTTQGLIFFGKLFIEISILWFVIYRVMLFFEGTRALQVMRGMIILLIIFLLSQKLNFAVLDWLLTKFFAISVVAILVIFHPEIRQGLARLGQRHLFGVMVREEELDYILREITSASEVLCKHKFGALIAIERTDPLSSYTESGVAIDSRVSSDLIQTIFSPSSILHDGGVVIQNGRLSAAGCLFPLNQNFELSRIFGMRHRAALGLSEETDAVIIVVSEERQDIALAYNGRLYKDMSKEELFSLAKKVLKPDNAKKDTKAEK